jgi:carbon storage regulator
MLILTRRPGESLYLGDTIKLKVLSIQGKQIKLGLELPGDMTVYREEVYLKIKEQNSLALQASEQDLLAAASLWQEDQKNS